MKKNISIFYPISFSMIIIGVLMIFEQFSLQNSQMNSINLGAALLTTSATLVGGIHYQRTQKILQIISYIFFITGIFFVFFGFLLTGFKEDSLIVILLSNLQTNPLVLVCLGITVGSIIQFETHLENLLLKNEEKLQHQVKTLTEEKIKLEESLKKATNIIESLGDQNNE